VRFHLLVPIAALAVGCSQPGVVVTDTRVDLGPRWLRLTPEEPLEAPGPRDELPQNGYTFSGWQAICFAKPSAVDSQRVYSSVELWASHPLPVDEVTWESGERRPSL
jgi:hypothetical protein